MEGSPATTFVAVSANTASCDILDARNCVCQMLPYILLLDHHYTKFDMVELPFVQKLVKHNWINKCEVLVS